ncbi:DUF975 family protein [Enterococcus rivorum]|uniref:DUF975 domain-containing protein n=1 Tax=Enterococcus rivorum TaxID=762845 RepID=A0A1E5KXA5_9ENTE|nr:DUF975 family protein [Enterococcus rivorum]MBP2099972.1 putative membrane protein [Enterococcus rivorum]OEH82497.1 hypothetical protein BCR26_13495 [Enterococcus rivorum]
MKSQVSNAQHRENARGALNNQWGTMAWITFLSGVISSVIGSIVKSIIGYSPDSASGNIINFLLDNFIFFAITYGTYYCALQVIRGKKVESSMLLTVFQSKYYIPMLIINFIQYVVNFLVGLIVLLPVLLTSGVGLYFSLMFNVMSVEKLQENLAGSLFLALTIVIASVLVSFLGIFISGVFQFAVWTKLDYPELGIGTALRYGLKLMQGRFGQYILLELSFIGWFILGILALFIGLLWVIPYNQVAVASFYRTACEEQGTFLEA